MNIIDLLTALYVGLGFNRGRKRGASEELYRLVRTGLAFLGGLGLFAFVRSVLVSVLGVEGGVAGALGFLASFAAVFALLRLIRVQIRVALKAKFGHLSALAGGIVGAVRSGVNSLVVLVAAVLSGLPALEEWVTDGSFIGHIVDSVLGIFS